MNLFKKLFSKLFKKKIKFEFEVGDKIISRDNEPGSYIIGTVSRHESVGKHGDHVTVIECSDTGQEYWCGGILKHYTKELADKLDTMPPIEQWNYLAHRHAQYSKKYGIEYKTYNCNCDECLSYAELMKDFE